MHLLSRSPRSRLAGLMTVVALTAAACGGGGDGAPAGAPTDAGPSTVADVLDRGSPLDGSAVDAVALGAGPTVAWFWAPWCTICRAEAPGIAEVAERYADQVTVFGVPGRGDQGSMERFVDDTGTDALLHLADLDGSIWASFGIFAQPAFAFIGADGSVEVVVGSLGRDGLATRIDALLGA